MKRPGHKPGVQPVPDVPIRLPLVQMTVDSDGAMTVLVDGETYEPPPHAPAWQRGSFSAILDAITTRLSTAVKVTVTEYDGTTFTDVVMPRNPTPVNPAADTPTPVAGAQARMSQPVTITGTGFLAGEDVAIAPLVAHSSADPDGQVRALAGQDLFPVTGVQELVLVGRVSGTLQFVRALP